MKITKEQFNEYENVRVSGITNMFDIRNIVAMTDLTRDQVFDIMKNYDNMRKSFINYNAESVDFSFHRPTRGRNRLLDEKILQEVREPDIDYPVED